MLFPNSPYKPYIRIAIGIAMVAFGIIGNAHLVLLGGAVLVGWGAWSAATGRSRPRGVAHPSDRFGGRP